MVAAVVVVVVAAGGRRCCYHGSVVCVVSREANAFVDIVNAQRGATKHLDQKRVTTAPKHVSSCPKERGRERDLERDKRV